MKLFSFLTDYQANQKQVLENLPVEKVAELLLIFQKALQERRRIFAFGNGGSGSNASHFITDLSKAASDQLPVRFKGLCLNESVSWITALGNDYSFDEIFSRQLMNFAEPGDIVFMMSVSGNSPNIVKAAEWSKANGIYTIALTGGKPNRLQDMADFFIGIDSTHYGRVEDAHMLICHMICYAFIEKAIAEK